jgi:hypothetical protein
MLKKYIKISLEAIENEEVITKVTEELSTILKEDAGLDIPAGTWFFDCLINQEHEGYVYLVTSPRNMKNMGRMYKQTQREKDALEAYINKLGLEMVDSIPYQEII